MNKEVLKPIIATLLTWFWLSLTLNLLIFLGREHTLFNWAMLGIIHCLMFYPAFKLCDYLDDIDMGFRRNPFRKERP